jgi:DNA polymerase IIIc chi subunit
MAGIDFNRQVFIPATQEAPRSPASRLMGSLILVVAVAALGFVGYKLVSEYSGSTPGAASKDLEQVQQQLTDMGKRIDQLEQRRRVVLAEPASVPSKPASDVAVKSPSAKPSGYKISAASVLQPQTHPGSHLAPMQIQQTPAPQPVAGQPDRRPYADDAVANDQAWQATADRLADVVGVVGSQQGEISQTRERLNQLLAQTRRSAVPFELRHGANPEPVGPVSLVLKSSDPKNQRYTVCVYLDNQCIELKNRAVNEVVAFVLSKDSAPLELVATKVLHDQIVGYLEVPSDKPTP